MTRIQSVSIGIGKTLSTFKKSTGGAVGGVIDLVAKGNISRSKRTPSTLMPTVSHPPVRPVSVPLGTGATGPTLIAQSSSKPAHILLAQSAVESQEEEEGSEGDELPTFHHGSAKSRTKQTKATIARPAPRPFPLQLASESPVSPRASRLRERNGSRHDGENDDDDVVEIVDVFTTPRGPSPPRSPTPSPSLVRPLLVHASAGPATATFVKSKQSSGFPTSPTKSNPQTDVEPHERTKQRRHASPDWDARVSRNERDGILKSPRKSAAHSSPRHVPRTRGRASSPTPLTLSHSAPHHAKNGTLWTGDAGECDASDSRRPQPEDSGSTRDDVGWKPQPSNTSAIYISSGSEDEGNAGLGIDNSGGGGEAEMNEDQDGCTDIDVDGWANTGMILSAPPSPARTCSPPANDLVPTVPVVEVTLPNPARVSKFKPAPAPAPAPASRVDVRAPSTECQVSDRSTSTSLKGSKNDEYIAAPRPVHRVPLLVARAKRSKGRNDDIIDLTSD